MPPRDSNFAIPKIYGHLQNAARHAAPTLIMKMRAGRRPLWLPAASVQLLISAPLSRTTSRTLEPEGPAGGEKYSAGNGGRGNTVRHTLRRHVNTAAGKVYDSETGPQRKRPCRMSAVVLHVGVPETAQRLKHQLSSQGFLDKEALQDR